MTIKHFTFERLSRGNLVVRILRSDEPAQDCEACGETAVQQLSVNGVALQYYFCLGHAFAGEA